METKKKSSTTMYGEQASAKKLLQLSIVRERRSPVVLEQTTTKHKHIAAIYECAPELLSGIQ